MDKRAKDKLVRSRGENGGGQDAQNDLHSRTGRWRELVADREKWKDIVRQAKAHNGL